MAATLDSEVDTALELLLDEGEPVTFERVHALVHEAQVSDLSTIEAPTSTRELTITC